MGSCRPSRPAKSPPLFPLPAPDPKPITRRIVQVLTKAQIPLGGLDGGMPQRNLDLLEWGVALVGELGEGAPQIMRCDLARPGKAGIVDNGLEDGLSRGRLAPTSGRVHLPQRPRTPVRRGALPRVARRSRAGRIDEPARPSSPAGTPASRSRPNSWPTPGLLDGNTST